MIRSQWRKAKGRGQRAEMVREHVTFFTTFISRPIISSINLINPINFPLLSSQSSSFLLTC